ncbi:MAG: hypothetical protein Fur0035_23040 [Anaerolineales bacterium]
MRKTVIARRLPIPNPDFQLPMLLRPLSPDEPANWPETLTRSATFTGLDSWLALAHQIYHFPLYRFQTETEDGVTGILALTQIHHPIFGRYLTTAPFGSYGGFAFDSAAARDLLLTEARRLAQTLGVEYLNLRFLAPAENPPAGWIQQPLYRTFLVDLTPSAEERLKSYSSDHRNHIRKALKKGFRLEFGRHELLADAYEALARSMRELGSPYHAKNYLKSMAELLGDSLEVAVLYSAAGELAGAGVFIRQGSSVTNLHANILRAFRADYAGEFLYWQTMEHYAAQGCTLFDLGRSLIGSGNEIFKMKWRPAALPLNYWYALRPGAELPALNQKNPKFAAAIWLWQRLPPFIVRAAGPLLINGLA